MAVLPQPYFTAKLKADSRQLKRSIQNGRHITLTKKLVIFSKFKEAACGNLHNQAANAYTSQPKPATQNINPKK
jgi:hypothetical protein